MYGILRKEIKLQNRQMQLLQTYSFDLAKKQQGKKTSQRVKKVFKLLFNKMLMSTIFKEFNSVIE